MQVYWYRDLHFHTQYFKSLWMPVSHLDTQCSVACSACMTESSSHGFPWRPSREIHLFQVSQDPQCVAADASDIPGTGRSRSPYNFQGAKSRAWAAVSSPAQASCFGTAVHSLHVLYMLEIIFPFCFLVWNLKIYSHFP